MSAAAISIVPEIKLRRILYATDLSDASRAAMPIVSAVARKYGSQLFVAHVWSPLVSPIVTTEGFAATETRQARDVKAGFEYVLKSKEFADIPVTPVLERGEPEEELCRLVQQHHIDLAIIGTHGRTGFRHLLMGSVAERLLRGLPCPVLTIGPNISKRFESQAEIKRIVFPTDLSLESQAVFPYLSTVAAASKAHVTILHLVPKDNHRHPSALDEAEILKREISRVFSPQLVPGCECNVIVEGGDPVQRILEHAQLESADLIGFGVRRAGEISTHFRETVPYKTVLQAECPVLTANFGE